MGNLADVTVHTPQANMEALGIKVLAVLIVVSVIVAIFRSLPKAVLIVVVLLLLSIGGFVTFHLKH